MSNIEYFKGILTSAGIYIYKRFVESAIGISSFKNFKKPHKENHPHNNLPPHKNRDNKPPSNKNESNPNDPNSPKDNPTNRYGIYDPEESPHGKVQRGRKSREPHNPQNVLDNSILVDAKKNSSRRAGWEADNETIGVFDEHRPGKFHGHTCTWDRATEDVQRALKQSKLANHKGKRIG